MNWLVMNPKCYKSINRGLQQYGLQRSFHTVEYKTSTSWKAVEAKANQVL